MFQNLPYHLGKKLIYQKLDPELKSIDIKKCVQLFHKANLITPCYHTSVSGLPLRASVDTTVFKLYFLDIGLINAAHQFQWQDFEKEFESSFVTKGYLAEQFIAQHLCFSEIPMSGPEVLFWLKDKTIGKAEIDFIQVKNGEIIPIEVKAGKGGRLKSFEVFIKEKHTISPPIQRGIKFSKEFFYKEQLQLENTIEIENWPYYAIEGFLSK